MEFMPCLFKRILMIFHNNFNSPWERYTMFDLSLSLKILTAYPIYYVDKSTQNQWRSHLQSNVPPERSLSRLKSRYEGLYRRQCFNFFFSILTKFTVYIYFSEDLLSVIQGSYFSLSKISNLFSSRRSLVGVAHLKRQTYLSRIFIRMNGVACHLKKGKLIWVLQSRKLCREVFRM